MRKLISIILLIFCCTISFADITVTGDVTLRKKIGQMIIVGFKGTTLTKNNPIYDDILNEDISGVILFSKDVLKVKARKKNTTRNITSPKQLKKLIKDINKLSPSKLFIAIDEEGGQISRLRSSMGFNVETLSHKELGEKNDTELTKKEAKTIAKNLKNLGINVNFAPCVDLAINKESPIIYKKGRSFSDNPKIVFKHAQAYIQAHNEYKILTVAKHFPGHGSAIYDSHKGFTDITSTWQKTELEPYIYLNKKWLLNAVMVAHVTNNKLDSNYPASLSKRTVTQLLKKKIGFKGLIFTDDMQMKAITNNYNLEDSIIAAINAGVDVLIFGNNLQYDRNIAKKFNDIVYNAVKDGKISQDRIEESYNKIMEIKSFLK
jgi:beta-N-acetylhexosaminidase